MSVTDSAIAHHLFFGTLFLKNSVNLSFIHLNLINCIALRIPFLLYPHLNFTLGSKLISSKNHFPLSLFHSPMSSSGSLTWVMYFISLSFHLYQPPSCHFICFTAYVSTQYLGISLRQFPFGWLAFAATLNLLTSFHTSSLLIVHFCLYN